MTTVRTNVVSSYTVVKGSLIDETYAVFSAWDFSKEKKENLDQLRNNNFIKAKSDSWLHDVAKVLNRRYDPAGFDRSLVLLAKSGCDIEEWKPLLLWHLTRDEFLLKDFLLHWLFPICYESTSYQVRHEDLHSYLINIAKRGVTPEHGWSATTLHRVATGLLRIAADFGMLKGNSVKEFVSYHLPERSFIYLFHTLLDKYKSPRKVIEAKDWRVFLLRPSDVEMELIRLHQLRKLEFEITGGLAHVSLPHKSVGDYAESMSEFVPGDRCEVDYADDKVEWLEPKTGQIHQAPIFIGVLGFSRLIFAWASENENSDNWQQSHRKMFDAFGGVPHVTVCDILRHGVTKTHRHGPDINPGYAEIASHYMTAVVPFRPDHPKDKALVDGTTRIVMRAFQFMYRRHTFTSVTEINYALAHVVDRINRKTHPGIKTSRLERWVTQEKPVLKALPTVAFEAVEWKLVRVHPDCTVSLESAYYSVPHQHQGKKVRIKLSATHVEIFVDHESVAHHKRDFVRHGIRHIIPEHLPENAKAYREETPQNLLLQARFVTGSLRGVIEELFARDTLGNLRRAQGLIRRGSGEIRDYGRENAEPRIRETIEQMRRFNNFGVRYFEATLRQLRQKSKSPVLTETTSEQCMTAISGY